jgi:hypothetical protein
MVIKLDDRIDELWNIIIKNITNNPRDIKTIPLNGGGIWFNVSTNGTTIFVNNAKTEKPSSKLRQTRNLHKKEFLKIYDIYEFRKRGKKVAQEATRVSKNQVYIYSIFKNCGGI